MSAEVVDRQDLLAGRYLLGDVIGRGGMGVVLRAWDNHLDRYVAVKLLSRLAMDPISRARFSAEGKTLAALNHPGLITLFDAATEGTDPYLVMELVDGQPLNERCNGTGMDVAESSPSEPGWPTRSATCTAATSCTGTSNPATCCWPTTVA